MNCYLFLWCRVEDYQDANEDHVCLYKPLSNHSTPQQQVVQFTFAPHLKGLSEVQHLQEGTMATPECTVVNVSSVLVTCIMRTYIPSTIQFEALMHKMPCIELTAMV